MKQSTFAVCGHAGPANIFASRSKLTLAPPVDLDAFESGDDPSLTLSGAKPADIGEYVRSVLLVEGSGVAALRPPPSLEPRPSMLFRGVPRCECAESSAAFALFGLDSDRAGVW